MLGKNTELIGDVLAQYRKRLEDTANEECECTPERVCRSCAARTRLADPDDQPSIKKLIWEGWL